MMVAMAARTNRSALGSTVRALRADGRLKPEDTALIRLAELLASKLDDLLAGGEKAYAVAAVGRLYLAVEEALRFAPGPGAPDAFQAFLDEVSVPSVGNGSTWST